MNDPIILEIETVTRAIASLLRSTITQIIREVPAESGASKANSRKDDFAVADNQTCKLYTGDEVAELFGVSRRHVHSLTANGLLPCVRIGTRVRYRQATLVEWLAEQEATTSHETNEKVPSTFLKTPSKSTSRSVKKLDRKSKMKTERCRKPQRTRPCNKPQDVDCVEEFVSGFQKLARSLDVDYESLPRMRSGDIMRIANVGIATFHGWQYLGRELPPEALENVTKWLLKQGSKSSNID